MLEYVILPFIAVGLAAIIQDCFKLGGIFFSATKWIYKRYFDDGVLEMLQNSNLSFFDKHEKIKSIIIDSAAKYKIFMLLFCISCLSTELTIIGSFIIGFNIKMLLMSLGLLGLILIVYEHSKK